jgi:hypothetical protein
VREFLFSVRDCSEPDCRTIVKDISIVHSNAHKVIAGFLFSVRDCSEPDCRTIVKDISIVHSNAHKVIAGFFLSPEPEVT